MRAFGIGLKKPTRQCQYEMLDSSVQAAGGSHLVCRLV
jgi:hypothetical protein